MKHYTVTVYEDPTKYHTFDVWGEKAKKVFVNEMKRLNHFYILCEATYDESEKEPVTILGSVSDARGTRED